MNNPCNVVNVCNEGKDYRVRVTNGYVGMSRNIFDPYTGHTFGIRMYSVAGQAQPFTWDYGVQFAPYCNEGVGGGAARAVQIYDIDYKDYKDKNGNDLYAAQDNSINARVDQDNRANTGYSWSLVNPPGYVGGAGSTTSQRNPGDWNGGEHSFNPLTIGSINSTQRYLFEFRALDYRNVLQIRLPGDQFDSLPSVGAACNKGPGAACTLDSTGSPTRTIQGLTPGQQVFEGATFINTGSTDWVSPPYQWQTVVNVPNSPHNLPNTAVEGDSFDTGNFPFVAGGYNTVKTITFQMLISGQTPQFGEKCTLILKVGPPPGASSIEASCEVTKLTVNYPSANPAPVSVIITNANNAGDTSTYNTTVPLDPITHIGVKTVNTFDMWSGMWPHDSYNYQFVVGGVPVAAPAGVDSTSPCLTPSCPSQGSLDDLEPGQAGKGNVTVHFVNDAGRSSGWPLNGSDNGYTFAATANPGLVVLSPNPQITSSGINAWNGGTLGVPVETDVNVTVSIRADWKGDFTVTLQGPAGTPSVSCSGEGTPSTRAYFKVTQGDLNTGGGFGVPSSGVCSQTDPGYISPTTPGYDGYAGGLRAYGNQNAGRGSSGDFGVLALGYNIGSANGEAGFYSRNNEIFADPSFTSGNMGGYLNPTSPPEAWHCVNDFFLKTRMSNPTDLGADPTINVDNLGTLQYTASGNGSTSNGCSAAGNIPQGRRTTIYVDGTVTIKNDICYAQTYDTTTRTNIPYFSLIVQGDIIVDYNVKQIDGLYVAQPSNSSNGRFRTCDSFCPNNTLTVNGAVLAQYVQLLREHGTVGPLGNDLNGITTEPAEVFNYTPAMILGQPNFSPQYSNVQALFSLPPVF